MIELYNSNTTRNSSHLSQHNHYPNQKLAQQNQRSSLSAREIFEDPFSMRRPENLRERNTDDIFSGILNHHANIFREVESFHKKIFKHVDNMFGKFGMDSMADFPTSKPFSHAERPVRKSETPSYYISKTYVYKTKQDPNTGKKYAEKYFSKNYAMQGNDGTMLVERQEGYHNTGNNLQRIAEERRINHTGKRLIQQRIKGQDGIMSHVHYENMREEDIDFFDREWDQRTEEIGFYRKHGNKLGYNNQSSSENNGCSVNESKIPKNTKRTSQNRLPLPTSAQPQNHARVRRSDIQPTYPQGRVIGTPLPNYNEPQHDQNRAIPLPEQRYEPDFEDIVNQNHEPNVVRNRPQRIRPENQQRASNANARSDGNFKNKNVSTNMPMAG